MRKYSKFIEKQHMPDLVLEDKKMPMIEISKLTNSLRFIHPGDDNEVSAARTTEPLPSNSAAVYFQAFVKSLSSRCECGVGIIQKDCALKRHPGMSSLSIGYLSTGDIFINGKKIKRILAYKSFSTVGIGVIYSKQQVFFTIDGKILQTLNFSYNANTWPRFYPCLSLRHQGDQIELRCRNFIFNFNEFLNKIVTQCVQEIEKQPTIDFNGMYSLVGDYLQFHGYKETLGKMKEHVGFKEFMPYVEHPFWEDKIKIANDEMESQNSSAGKVEDNPRIEDEMEEELIVHRKCSTRQRIMSDYWGEILPTQLPRKRTIQNELMESKRKSSVISNIQMEQQDKKSSKHDFPSDLLPSGQKSLSTKQRFFTETRIKIMHHIRQQEIEQAYSLMQEHIPRIFEILAYLEAYFYMHIYLRKLKNDGAGQAVLYIRSENQKFKNFKDQLYPVFCTSGKLKFVDFSALMGLVSLKVGTKCEILSSQQFDMFSNYVNELILKNMGLFPASRLDTFVNHLKCIENKSAQYHINGLSISCDF